VSLVLRPLAQADVPGLALLHARLYPGASPALYAGYALEMLFRNPWADPAIPSWLAELDGRMVGALGVVPRRMRLGERSLRVAVSCQLMVDPERGSGLVALELLRRFFAGPQDLAIADGANDASRRLWEASGGTASALHSLHWIRLLRPAQGLLGLARGRWRKLSAVAAPFAAMLDACVASRSSAPYAEEPLDAATLRGALGELRQYTLKPDYDADSLDWLLGQARAKRRHGELQACLARERGGRIAGWFLYYLNGGVSQVLQLGARRGCLEPMLEQLSHHARERGARALEGRMDPGLAPALQGKRVLLQNRGIWTLLHARDQALLVPFLRGDAFFSRLDGEWWMRFAGEPQPAAKRGQDPFIEKGARAPGGKVQLSAGSGVRAPSPN
jgi:hypothetical protein